MPSAEEWEAFVSRVAAELGLQRLGRGSGGRERRLDELVFGKHNYLVSSLRHRVAHLTRKVPCKCGDSNGGGGGDGASDASADDRLDVLAVYFDAYAQGPSGGVHGGASATVLDAAIGVATATEADPDGYVTAQLTVNYRRIVPLGTYALALARVHERAAALRGGGGGGRRSSDAGADESDIGDKRAARVAYGHAELLDATALLRSGERIVYADATAVYVKPRRRDRDGNAQRAPQRDEVAVSGERNSSRHCARDGRMRRLRARIHCVHAKL